MKKIIITVILVTLAMVTNAQFFVGGQLGFSSNTKELESPSSLYWYPSYKTKQNTFTFAPAFGYQVNDRLAIGLRPGFILQNQTDFDVYRCGMSGCDTVDIKTRGTAFALEVFGQYTFLQVGKFRVWADAGIGFGGGKSKEELKPHKKELSSTKNDLEKSNVFGINIKPVLAYDVTERITLTANLNFLGFGFVSSTTKDLQTKQKYKESNFDLNVNLNKVSSGSRVDIGYDPYWGGLNVITVSSGITIGAVYRF
jgi:opacity protein-like surface antigen